MYFGLDCEYDLFLVLLYIYFMVAGSLFLNAPMVFLPVWRCFKLEGIRIFAFFNLFLMRCFFKDCLINSGFIFTNFRFFIIKLFFTLWIQLLEFGLFLVYLVKNKIWNIIKLLLFRIVEIEIEIFKIVIDFNQGINKFLFFINFGFLVLDCFELAVIAVDQMGL